jgi:hypothetical protein
MCLDIANKASIKRMRRAYKGFNFDHVWDSLPHYPFYTAPFTPGEEIAKYPDSPGFHAFKRLEDAQDWQESGLVIEVELRDVNATGAQGKRYHDKTRRYHDRAAVRADRLFIAKDATVWYRQTTRGKWKQTTLDRILKRAQRAQAARSV